MKLVKTHNNAYVFLVGLGERRLLQQLIALLQQLPLNCPPISKGLQDGAKRAERQEMLNTFLKEQRAETIRDTLVLLADEKFTKAKQIGALYWSISKVDLELILMTLNDVRVSCWYVLGQPDPTKPQKESMMAAAMELAGFFEEHLLDLTQHD